MPSDAPTHDFDHTFDTLRYLAAQARSQEQERQRAQEARRQAEEAARVAQQVAELERLAYTAWARLLAGLHAPALPWKGYLDTSGEHRPLAVAYVGRSVFITYTPGRQHDEFAMVSHRVDSPDPYQITPVNSPTALADALDHVPDVTPREPVG